MHGIWAAVLVALVANDFLQLHETFGAVFVDTLGLPSIAFLSAQDVGALLVWTVAALVLGAGLLIGYARADEVGRRDSRRMLR